MDGLLSKLMIVLFVVWVVSVTLFSSDGLQNDAKDMKDTTQDTIKDANDVLIDFTK